MVLMAINRGSLSLNHNRGALDANFKFDSLTSLRGIAALCTVLIHLLAIWGANFPAFKDWTLFRQFALHSYLFVDFFFVLSGFVISHAYGKIFVKSLNFGNYVGFMRARFARVYPLHFTLLIVYVALAAAGVKQTQENPEWSIVANLILVQAMGYFSHTTWNQPSWSISVEWWTYIIFPFAVPLAFRYIRRRAAVCCLIISIIMFATLSTHFGSADLTVGFAFFRCLIGFFAGSCLYLVVRNYGHIWVTHAFLNSVLVAIVLTLTFVPSPFSDIFAFVGFCTVVYAASKSGSDRHWLRRPVLIWIGEISYSIYLLHSLLLHVFAKMMSAFEKFSVFPERHQIVFFLIALTLFEVAILLLANLSHKFIEQPARKLLSPRRADARPSLEFMAVSDEDLSYVNKA